MEKGKKGVQPEGSWRSATHLERLSLRPRNQSKCAQNAKRRQASRNYLFTAAQKASQSRSMGNTARIQRLSIQSQPSFTTSCFSSHAPRRASPAARQHLAKWTISVWQGSPGPALEGGRSQRRWQIYPPCCRTLCPIKSKMPVSGCGLVRMLLGFEGQIHVRSPPFSSAAALEWLSLKPPTCCCRMYEYVVLILVRAACLAWLDGYMYYQYGLRPWNTRHVWLRDLHEELGTVLSHG